MFSSILLPLDGSSNAAKPLRTAAWLAGKLNSRLHVLTATEEPRSATIALEQLKVPADLEKQVILHQSRANAEQAILQTMEELHTDLLVISALGEGKAASCADLPVGHVVRTVLQQTEVPVLLAPAAFTERLPMRSALIPVSGEQGTDEALDHAIHLATSLQLRLYVAHVTSPPKMDEPDSTPGTRYPSAADGPLSDLLRRACPHCGPEEFERVVEKVCLRHGKVADELLNLAARMPADLLIVGWHGKLQNGRAELIKQVLLNMNCPILLFRSRTEPYFHLNVGEEFE